MNVTVPEYLDVETRALQLGLEPPGSLAILPRGFDSGAAEPPAHESHSATIRKLLKESGVDARPVRARLVGQLPRYSREPAKWANRDIHSKAEAQAVLDEVRIAIRAGTFDSCGQAPQEVSPMTVREFAEIYKERHAVTRKLSLADDRLGHPTDHGTVR